MDVFFEGFREGFKAIFPFVNVFVGHADRVMYVNLYDTMNVMTSM